MLTYFIFAFRYSLQSGMIQCVTDCNADSGCCKVVGPLQLAVLNKNEKKPATIRCQSESDCSFILKSSLSGKCYLLLLTRLVFPWPSGQAFWIEGDGPAGDKRHLNCCFALRTGGKKAILGEISGWFFDQRLLLLRFYTMEFIAWKERSIEQLFFSKDDFCIFHKFLNETLIFC